MATNNYQKYISQSGSVEFRIWGSDLAAAMQACGLVKTTDTGQIDWATVLVAGTANTAAGYEIYRFNDALQATKPVFIKIEYGSGGSSSRPQLWITAGTSTNGAGTIGSVNTTRFTCGAGNNLASTVTAYHTYVCHKDGYLGVAFKAGAHSVSPTGLFMFAVGRTVDDLGVENGDGIWIAHKMDQPSATAGAEGGTQLVILRVATNTVAVSQGPVGQVPSNFCLVPFGPATSAVSTDFQAYKWYYIMPRVRPMMHMCTVISSEYAQGATFSTALVGTTPRTYICLGGAFAHCSSLSIAAIAAPTQGNNHVPAMLCGSKTMAVLAAPQYDDPSTSMSGIGTQLPAPSNPTPVPDTPIVYIEIPITTGSGFIT